MSCTMRSRSVWVVQSRRGVFPVDGLNRKKRRERMKYPHRFNKPNPKTRYREVGEDGRDGSQLELVSKTMGLETGMAVMWLGTSSGSPTRYRNVSSILLRLPEKNLLFDAGEGTQTQLLKAEIFPSTIKRIFITHLHGDHCFGLPGLLSLINQVRIFSDKGERMYVHGPPGLGVPNPFSSLTVDLVAQELIRMALPHWFDRFRMPITIVEFSTDADVDTSPQKLDPNGHVVLEKMPPTDEQPIRQEGSQIRGRKQNNINIWRGYKWCIDTGDGITVTASQLQHRVSCWGYVVQEAGYSPAQWELDLWKKQQLGNGTDPNTLSDEAGRAALAYNGRKLVILGDTCNSETMLSIGQQADLLSHEATFSQEMQHKALRAQHSTATMAGQLAKKLDAKQLVLTHFSPRYGSQGDALEEGDNDKDVQRLVEQAKRAFGKTAVMAAYDFMNLDVPINRQTQLHL